MRVDVVELTQELPQGLIDWWNEAAGAFASPPGGSDMTSAVEWHLALASAFHSDDDARVLVAITPGESVAAILPVCRRGGRFGQIGDTVALLTDSYCGRVALHVDSSAGDGFSCLIKQLDSEFPRWSTLEMILVDHNPRTAFALRSARSSFCAVETVSLPESPYIAIPTSFEEYFKTLKPNFRTEVRRGERRLRETGTLSRRLFVSPAEVDEYWEALQRIERESWKESAGTSITTVPKQERFYREVLPRVAAAGQLLAPVLYLDDRPIAHKLCLARDGVASVFKMSYADDLKRFYPSTVLLAGYLEDLVSRGVQFLDFMGKCDEFKMRWTSLTYGCTKHILFRNSFAGRLAHTRYRLARRVNAMRQRAGRHGTAISEA